jgi:hypothetical protein
LLPVLRGGSAQGAGGGRGAGEVGRRRAILRMPNQILNTVGLALNMVGVVLLFFYGPSQPNLEEGISLGVEGVIVEEHNAKVRRLRSRHELFSRIALVLIFIGFLLMLIATWAIEG